MTPRNKYEIKINIPVNLMLLKMGLARNMPGISVYLFAQYPLYSGTIYIIMRRAGMATLSSSSLNILAEDTAFSNETLTPKSTANGSTEIIRSIEYTFLINDDDNADISRSPLINRHLPPQTGTTMGTPRNIAVNTGTTGTSAVADPFEYLTEDQNHKHIAIKLNRTVDKKDRYNSHNAFLKQCLNDKVIPLNFKFTVDPSIGNHDEIFLKDWYNVIKTCQENLVKLTIEYTEITIAETETTITQLGNNLKANASNQVYTKAKNIVDATSTKTKAVLNIRKRKKLNFIKYGKPSKQENSNTAQNKDSPPRNLQNKRHTANKPRAPIDKGEPPQILEWNSNGQSSGERQNVLKQKDALIRNLQQELKQKHTVIHTNTHANDNIDAAIKEKDQIIQTLKYYLQQQSQRQQQAASRETQHQHQVLTGQTQQPQYSTVRDEHWYRSSTGLPTKPATKKLPTAQIKSRAKKKSSVRSQKKWHSYGNKKLGKTIPDYTKFAVDPYNTVYHLSSK